MRKLIYIALFSIGLGFSNHAEAQLCDTIATICSKHMSTQFISDGQTYRALLLNDQYAEFHTTFYGGTTYRIAACSGMTDGNLIFTIRDNEDHVLFTNKDHKNAPYWDFKITSTLDCKIEAALNPDTQASGCAVILIGFKQ